jgi:hypothetical protein
MTFILYGICNLLGMVFYYFCVPETRGVALGKDMSRAFGQEDLKDTEGEGAVDEVEDIDDETPLLSAERRRRRSSIAILV